MISKILSQIESINSSLDWIKKNRPADYNQKFLNLVEERCKLQKLRVAQMDNPAIAAYGVSQVGKSYLMNCILQKNGSPFMLDGDGKKYNFIEEMNPKTDNSEATGVVTRFSSFGRDPKKYSKEYPILMRCLSLSDIILVLSDGYYNDISDYTTYSEDELKEFAEEKYEYYKSKASIANSPITADNILDIKNYYIKHIHNAQTFIHTSFFDRLALVADKIPSSDWVSVFSILWHKSEYQTKLFKKMLATLDKLQHSEYVYLPTQALLHDGINENTVMSVQCLNELFLSSPKHYTDAYLRKGDNYVKVEQLTKSEVCAVCAEIIVKIGDEYIENTNSYSLAHIQDLGVRESLVNGRTISKNDAGDSIVEVKMSILKDNDMLDFPGARSRKKELLSTLQEDAILINVLLRGKVAYLFNMYNESMLINILLYCHHAAQNDVTDMPLLLHDWIITYVGDTVEKRRKTLELTDGISPLFYIATKFNMDMQEKTESIANGLNALNGRWQQRFEKVLYHQCFNADGSLDSEKQKIFLNWTRSGECFSNSYLLRDFKFSGPLASKIYENERTANRRMTIQQDYYDDMRNTFCSSEFVKRFFANPELSWDVAASMDNDGALFILERLSKVAACMDKTRDEQFQSILDSVSRKVLGAMEGYYVSTDQDELLENNIRKAKSIFREMDFTCNMDNYYFGHLLQALQLTETACYQVVQRIMQSPEINGKVNDFKDYEIIRNSCKNSGYSIDDASSENDKWNCIINTYGFLTKEEAAEFLIKKGIEFPKLFSGSYKRKMNSCIIADSVFDKWSERLKSVEFTNGLTTDNGFDATIMTTMIDNLINSSSFVNLRDVMAGAIAEYVNVVNIQTANCSLLADILASIINDFVLDFGFSYLSSETKEKAKLLCEKRKIPGFKYIEKELPAKFEEADLTQLFNDMSTSPKAILPSFDDNYNKWIEYMFISFVANLDVPDFDHEANLALAGILENIKCNH